MIKTRFAPSPTGFLHIGGLRTALYSYLFARKHKGEFLLRIEDTDRERFVEGGIENILRSLSWAGIAPDAGVVLADDGTIVQRGKNGPYIQSERLDIYQKYSEKLLKDGHAYRCFCTKERLEEVRMVQEASKQPTGYDGFCRGLSAEESAQKMSTGVPSVLRMKTPRDGVTAFTDLVRGAVEFRNALIEDQVLIKSDGFPTYHFAVVVDDHSMGITHVIRGEEWLPSTPKHLLLYAMFGWKPPEFGHLSLLVNEQKQKLSKRHGDVSVEDFREKGYLPEAIVNFIAFLGWNPGDERELFTVAELEKEFSLEKVSKAAAVFNREKLDWYNSQYIRRLEDKQLAALCLPYLTAAGIANADSAFVISAMPLVKERLVKLADAPELLGFLFAEDLAYEAELLVWKKSTRDTAQTVLTELDRYLNTKDIQPWDEASLSAAVGEWVAEKGLTNGDVLWPMRVALSGQKNSPGPFEIAAVLGKEKTLRRLKSATERLGASR
jgi:nondiscriminating glutamyl-tRNA synthetase